LTNERADTRLSTPRDAAAKVVARMVGPADPLLSSHAGKPGGRKGSERLETKLLTNEGGVTKVRLPVDRSQQRESVAPSVLEN
jgi:hypothetical protein